MDVIFHCELQKCKILLKFWTLLSYLIALTVSPCAISSSGTSSGRNLAGVIHGHFELIGNSVTIISPLLNPSRTRPEASSIVRNPLPLLGGTSITAGCDVLLAGDNCGLLRAGLDAVDNCTGDNFSLVTWTDSVAKTAGASSILLMTFCRGCA